MLRRFCILDLSKHCVAIQSDCDSCQTPAMLIFTRPPFPKTYAVLNELLNGTVCKERAEALVKTIRWAFWLLFIILLSLFASQATGDCSILCDRSVWWGHTKLIIVCRRLRAVKKERLLVVYMFVVFALGARTVKMFYFALLWHHLKKASRLDSFR